MTAALRDVDLSDPSFVQDPYPVFAAARRDAAVHWHEASGMWLAVGHAAAGAVLRARTLGRVWTPPAEPMPVFSLIHVHSLLENEPPVHTRLRRLVAGAFARGHVERLRPRVLALAEQLADDVAHAGAGGAVVDLIAAYAEPLPVAVIAELLGVPASDHGLLRPWSNAIVKMYEYGISAEQRAAAEAASAEFVAYLRELVVQRRRQPGDDLISSMLTETDNAGSGGRLSEDELVTTCTLLLNAGHEATVNVVGNGMAALFARPDELARLRANPELVPGAVEELIRFDSPLQLFERTALSDTDIAGVTVAAGTKIAALLGAANRDETVFTDPDRLDVGRTPNQHLGFGAGIHFCVGAPLARLELQASLSTLLTRFPSMALSATPVRRPEFVIRGVESLLVTIGGTP